MLTWQLPTACGAHAARNVMKWSFLSTCHGEIGRLKTCWTVTESLAGASGQIMERLPYWPGGVLRSEEAELLPPDQVLRQLCIIAGASPDVVEEICEFWMYWKERTACVVEGACGRELDESAASRVTWVIMSLRAFST